MLLYEGKAKQVYSTDNENEYIVYYKEGAATPQKAEGLLFCKQTERGWQRNDEKRSKRAGKRAGGKNDAGGKMQSVEI